MNNMQIGKHYLLGFLSICLGICGILFFMDTEYIDTKKDTLSFLFQEEKREQEEKNGILASFITPKINKYSGPVTESMLTCMDGYDTEVIKNIYPLDKLSIEDGAVNVQIPDSSKVMQDRTQIKNEIMPVFGHAVNNQEINWVWDGENRVYTFETYPGDEALWYCYLRKETIFFTNFFQITQLEQVDPLPPISEYRVEAMADGIYLTWDYDYSELKSLIDNEMINFIVEYKKANEGDFAWKTAKNNGYPFISFEEKKDENSFYWGEPLEYGEAYDIKIVVDSTVDWYADSSPLIFQIETDELQFPSDIEDVKKVNTDIIASIYAQSELGSDGTYIYTFHPDVEKEGGNVFVNIYDKENTKKYTKDLQVTETDKFFTNREGNIEHAYQIQKAFQIDEVGVYTAKLCFGTTAENCREYGLPSEIEVLDFTCNELFAGHNVRDADRINIVFIGSRYRKFSDFLLAVTESLRWDGTPAVFTIFDEELQKDKVYDLGWGFFAIEPFKSNKDKFNLWYVDEPMTTLTNYVENICGLPYEYDAIYANRSFLGMLGRTRSFTYKAQFGEERAKGDSENMFSPSHNYMPYDEFGTHSLYYELFAHETAHAVFGLDDEYTESMDSDPFYGEVSCMPTQEEAEKKWGDLIGNIDPFLAEVHTALSEYNIDTYEVEDCKRENQNEPESAENECIRDENGDITWITLEKERYPESDFITQYFQGGCLAPYEDERVIKPTKESLMSANYPILGSVNRREVERVLNMFTGK